MTRSYIVKKQKAGHFSCLMPQLQKSKKNNSTKATKVTILTIDFEKGTIGSFI